VVDVTNNNSKALFGRTGEFASENVHITERYIFSADGTRYNYVATFDDPSVYTPVERHHSGQTPHRERRGRWLALRSGGKQIRQPDRDRTRRTHLH
jgi:hypothetical protein